MGNQLADTDGILTVVTAASGHTQNHNQCQNQRDQLFHFLFLPFFAPSGRVMPLLYHRTSSNVNAKNGKYAFILFSISVHNAQMFLAQKLSPYFYLTFPFSPHFCVCLCIYFACRLTPISHQRIGVRSFYQEFLNYVPVTFAENPNR